MRIGKDDELWRGFGLGHVTLWYTEMGEQNDSHGLGCFLDTASRVKISSIFSTRGREFLLNEGPEVGKNQYLQCPEIAWEIGNQPLIVLIVQAVK